MSNAIRPLRALFQEYHEGAQVKMQCRLCDWYWSEVMTGLGWTLSPYGLFQVVKHMKGHTQP